MWDLQIANPLGSISWRKLFVVAASLVVTVFAYLILISPTAHAASDVTHQGGDLVYNNNTYTGPTKATGQESYNLPADTQIYAYVEPATGTSGAQKVHFIYFDPTVDVPKATSAKYVEYVYVPPSNYSQPSNQKDLSVDTTATSSSASSCVVPGGMGWIICPLSNTLANGMDLIYSFISDFMKTQPLQTSQQDTLYQAWSLIRNLANIIFVIGFIIIIYSQLTSFGISNYGIKKILPRLIIAAILVNISYYICAIAVDLSNILGTSTHDMIYSLRDNIFNHSTGHVNDSRVFSWSSIVGFILSGGALAGAGIAGAHIAVIGIGGSLVAMIYFVLPMLLGIFLTVLVILLILAARQALIVCLIIISPLAFVAYLLPGTEKWFDKWREVFMTMLIFFPAFSLVFSGAQLAGSLIIQNNSSINMILLGLAIQVAPLIITPLLLKLSGRVLGTIAGMINNPKKGLLDRTRNWASERGEMHRQKGLGDMSKTGVLRRYARYHDDRTRRLKERTANYTAMSDNRYNQSALHAEQDRIKREVHEQAEIIEKKLDLKWNAHVKVDAHALERDLELRILTDENTRAKAELDERYENIKAGVAPVYGPQNKNMTELLNRATDTTEQLALLAMASQAAKNIQQRNLNENLSVEKILDTTGKVTNQEAYDASQARLKVAAGIDPNGMIRAQANAATALVKIQTEVLENNVKLLQSKALAKGDTVKNFTAKIIDDAKDGISKESADVIEAAYEVQAQEGNVWAFEEARGSTHTDQSMLTRVIARNSPTFKTKGGFGWQANPNLTIEKLGARFDEERGVTHIGDLGNTAAENISGLKAGWLENVAKRIDLDIGYAAAQGKTADLQKAYDNFYQALNNPEVMKAVGDRAGDVRKIEAALYSSGYRPTPRLER